MLLFQYSVHLYMVCNITKQSKSSTFSFLTIKNLSGIMHQTTLQAVSTEDTNQHKPEDEVPFFFASVQSSP